MISNGSAPTDQQGLKPWHRWALDRGRTPLPEKAGARPWETKSTNTSQDQTSSGNTPGSAPSSGDGTNQSASQPTTVCGNEHTGIVTMLTLSLRCLDCRRLSLQILAHRGDRAPDPPEA